MLPLEFVSLGYRTVATDLDPFPVQGAGFDYVLADLRSPPFKPGSFDGVCVVSTLEHVGIGYYDARRESEDDLAMVRALWTILRPGGILIVTVPFGRAGVGRLQRAYDAARLHRMKERWIPLEERYYISRGKVWEETTEGEASGMDSVNGTRAVALLLLKRPEG